MGDQGTAAGTGVQISTKIRGATQIFSHGLGAGIGCIHLAAQGFELGQGDIAGAARRGGRLDEVAVGVELGRRKRHRALRGQRRGEDVGRGMQIALRMPAHELLVAGEGHVALQDAGAHARAGFIGFFCVFGELQCRAAMPDRKIALPERAFRTGLEFVLERAGGHVIDQKVRARTDLNVRVLAAESVFAHQTLIAGRQRECGQQGENSSNG